MEGHRTVVRKFSELLLARGQLVSAAVVDRPQPQCTVVCRARGSSMDFCSDFWRTPRHHQSSTGRSRFQHCWRNLPGHADGIQRYARSCSLGPVQSLGASRLITAGLSLTSSRAASTADREVAFNRFLEGTGGQPGVGAGQYSLAEPAVDSSLVEVSPLKAAADAAMSPEKSNGVPGDHTAAASPPSPPAPNTPQGMSSTPIRHPL